MILSTFGQLKAQIARVCGATGMPVTDPRVMEFTNLAIQELLNEGDFPWTVARLYLRICNGRFVLPSEFDRAISMSVDGIPQQINSPWFETTSGSPWSVYGWSEDYSTFANLNGWFNDGFTLDRDEVFQFREIPCDQGYYLEVQTQYNESVNGVYPNIVLKGYDFDRNPIGQPDGSEGDTISLRTAPQLSASTFSQISGIIKPVTKGEVYVYAVGINGDRIHVGTYAPKETAPYYRSYKVVGTPQCRLSCVLVRARKRYKPITTDNDFVLCANVPALKKMVQAVWYSDASELEKYAAYKALAVDILKKEALAYRGKSRIPAITFQHGFGMGIIPPVR